MPTDTSIALLHSTIASVLSIPEASIDDSLAPDKVAAWDSVMHLNLVMAIEDAFGVAFSPDEMVAINTVGLIREALAKHGK